MTTLTAVAGFDHYIRGAAELERTDRGGLLPHRLPGWARAQCSDPQLAMAESQPSGVRLAMRTTATTIELDTIPTKRVYVGAAPRPDGVYDLRLDGELAARATVLSGDTLTVDMSTGTFRHDLGAPGTVRFEGLPATEKDAEVWLPHDETTELMAVRTDAPVKSIPTDGRRVWLHHGSSISHGSTAASPSTIWPALAAAAGGVDLVNLGLGGSALLDPFAARVMRDTTADLLSVKIGINMINTDVMRLRAFGPAVHGFLDTIREGHPDVPLLVISPILCPIHEDTPGPSALDPEAMSQGRLEFRATGDPADITLGRLTLNVIRRELERIVAQRAVTDPQLTYLDGRVLYGVEDNLKTPLPDELHPDAATHELIATRFATHAFGASGPFELSW
jgi:GDSL-like Lipase/Acylhydrolase family